MARGREEGLSSVPVFASVHFAAKRGDKVLLRRLLKDADDALVNEPESLHGLTPLHVAAHHGHVLIVKYLIRRGAQVDAVDSKGWTALHHAASRGRHEVCQTLLSLGSNPNILTFLHLYSPLLILISGHSCLTDNILLETLTSFLSSGANLNAQDANGNTPCHEAARIGCRNVIAFLIDNGADISLTTRQHQTVYDIAEAEGRIDVLETLLQYRSAKESLRYGQLPASSADGARYYGCVREVDDDGCLAPLQIRKLSGGSVVVPSKSASSGHSLGIFAAQSTHHRSGSGGEEAHGGGGHPVKKKSSMGSGKKGASSSPIPTTIPSHREKNIEEALMGVMPRRKTSSSKKTSGGSSSSRPGSPITGAVKGSRPSSPIILSSTASGGTSLKLSGGQGTNNLSIAPVGGAAGGGRGGAVGGATGNTSHSAGSGGTILAGSGGAVGSGNSVSGSCGGILSTSAGAAANSCSIVAASASSSAGSVAGSVADMLPLKKRGKGHQASGTASSNPPTAVANGGTEVAERAKGKKVSQSIREFSKSRGGIGIMPRVDAALNTEVHEAILLKAVSMLAVRVDAGVLIFLLPSFRLHHSLCHGSIRKICHDDRSFIAILMPQQVQLSNS